MQQATIGEEQRETLETMSLLGALYRDLQQYDEAERLYEKTLEVRRRVLGPEDRETLGSITNLGMLYGTIGRIEEAAEMFETSLPLKRRVLGPDHPWTGYARDALAYTYELLDRRDDALPLYREALGLLLAAADEPDADAETINKAAWSLLTHPYPELHDPDRAVALAERACAAEEAEGGSNLWSYLDTLALARHRTGDTAVAVELIERAMELMPPDANPALRTTLERNRQTFATALAQQQQAASDAGGGSEP